VTLENLQSTLQRIAEIRGRFEPAPAMPVQTDKSADTFNNALTQAMDSAVPAPAELEMMIQNQASKQGVDANLLKAVIKNESNFNPKAVSSVGAQGLMQLMPATAAGLGVENSFNPAQNIEGGAKYLKNLLQKYDQSVPKALAAYNAGPGAVDRYDGIPPYKETTQYVRKVMNSYQAYQNATGG
jgi:soluble lytic murein transglycosylase-like protein